MHRLIKAKGVSFSFGFSFQLIHYCSCAICKSEAGLLSTVCTMQVDSWLLCTADWSLPIHLFESVCVCVCVCVCGERERGKKEGEEDFHSLIQGLHPVSYNLPRTCKIQGRTIFEWHKKKGWEMLQCFQWRKYNWEDSLKFSALFCFVL